MERTTCIDCSTNPATSSRTDVSPRWGLAALAAAVLLPSIGTSIANVALPALQASLGAPQHQVQWVVIGYLLAMTTLVVGAGRLGDILGRRRLLLAGIATYAAGSLACSAAPTLAMLVGGRIVQGAGAAIMAALAMAMVGSLVPKERTGRALGLLGTMSAVGTALGPTLGGVLLSIWDWRAIFVASAALAAVALVVARTSLPDDDSAARQSRAGFDVAGTAWLGASVGAYAWALTSGRGSLGTTGLALLAVAVVAAIMFVRVENRSASPLVRISMLRDRTLAAGFATSALVSTVMMTTLVVGPFHLALALGLAPVAVGAIVSTGPLAAALASAVAGRTVDRIGSRRVVIGGLSAIAAGAFAQAAMPLSAGALGYVATIVAMTTGYAFFQTGNNAATLAAVPAEDRGVASGVLTLSRNLGLVTGASAMLAIFAIAAGETSIGAAEPSRIASGTSVAFAVAGVLAVVALLVVARQGRRVRRGLE